MGYGPSGVYILDQRGKSVIHRAFRRDAPASSLVSELFTRLGLEGEETTQPPLFRHCDLTYMWVRTSNLIVVGTSGLNANAMMVFAFVYRLIDVLTEYFGVLEEESIRDNFVIIYELMDEMMDDGYPQITDSQVLQGYIHSESNRLENSREVVLPEMVSDAVSWRPRGIVHKQNEAYLDVVERVNLLVAADGTVLSSDIQGSVRIRSMLSGMPDLKLGLNDKVMMESAGKKLRGSMIELEDIRFHQCVRLVKFETDRAICFVPPDGEFELMAYRLSKRVKPLIVVECTVEMHNQSRISYIVKANAQYRARLVAKDVSIHVPTPSDSHMAQFKSTIGELKHIPGSSLFAWNIKQFPGGREYVAKAEFALPSVSADDAGSFRKVPITVQFTVPYYTVSGIQVRYLRVEESSGYHASTWVQYVTKNGEYQFRLG